MKKNAVNSIITTVALLTTISAYCTLPKGRALSEQEKVAARGLQSTTYLPCNKCVPLPGETTSCDKYNGTVNNGDPCYRINENPDKKWCNGTKGQVPKSSKTKDVNDHQLDFPCDLRYLICKIAEKQDAGKWTLTEPTQLPGCGSYSSCNENGPTQTPDDCAKVEEWEPPTE